MQIPFDLKALTDQIQTFQSNFPEHLDINRLLGNIRSAMTLWIEQCVATIVEQQFRSRNFLTTLKQIAAKSGLRFHGFKPTSIRLLSGNAISIDSPYFVRAASKRRCSRKRKKRTAGTGSHVGLSYLGFLSRASTLLVSSVVQSALLCPSFDVAVQTLGSYGIQLNVKTIRRFCLELGAKAMKSRTDIALTDADSAASDRILFVCMDGGRLRERRTKQGRRPENLKRQGYHTDWREPIQIVIQVLDTNGNPCKDIAPIYDATLAGIDGAFDLLETYLKKLNASNSRSVVFCGDGARSYWKRFPLLAQKLGIKSHYEIIDYTHAKQNLQEIIDMLPESMDSKKLTEIITDWKNLLWHGRLGEILSQICSLIQSPSIRKAALKKFMNYFLKNDHRMRYSRFRELGLPTGSGCVESAIRRVINLRLKAPGIFWKEKTAEVMLFLRSTLLCGRWENLLKNLFNLNRSGGLLCH